MKLRKLLVIPICTVVFCIVIPVLASFSGAKKGAPPIHTPGGGSEIELYKTVKVLFSDTGEIAYLPLEEYIVGVVAAEVSPSYNIEALKAQAVAARTHTLYKQLHGGNMISQHKGADVCTDYHHCKAYASPAKREADWGKDAAKNGEKVADAVNITAGEVLVYGGEPINSVFFAISSGKTENISEVWGGENLPYLSSVESPEDKLAKGYETTVKIPLDDFYDRLISEGVSVNRAAGEGEIASGISHTSGGSVDKITFFDKQFKGTKVRTLFGLRSANFELKFEGGEAVFTVRGYGHGVGMSQEGANFCAREGMGYRDILSKYYRGTQVVKKG